MNFINMTPKLQELANDEVPMKKSQESNYRMQIVWRNVVILSYFHLASLYALYLACYKARFWTIVWFFAVGIVSNIGITAGAHRLWAHKAYKAKWPMKLILMIFQSVAYQDSILHWARDHRVHHRYTDTNADPYSAHRGFFFSHVGWLLVRKHPDVISAKIDLTDLKQDPFVMFQKRWYALLMPLCCFIIPSLVPYWAFGESLWCAWHLAICRYCINLHVTWLVNSAAHMWGYKPYNKLITPVENAIVSLLAFGEGWHNYHHVFPWDYKAAELGNYSLNITTAFIDFFAYLGLAYDLKTASDDMIKKRVVQNSKLD
ncbi:acyl-CoA Delta-9 desaturase isoform X1 [Linepithema humile]|uniref:acyl-CoA Delta-9 desaturase isoform X1 n=2 Tax=Linepithema humile TaxID=83485 RepID=UPI00351F47F1